MKHPALARVFAVVLAILCLLLLANGVRGFGKANAEHEERLAFSAKYATRIANYQELENKLANSISYDEAYAELEKLMEEHDAAAARHRTDTALYTAEKGGNTMGANLIWEYVPQVKSAKRELQMAQAQLDSVEEAYAAVKGDIGEISAIAGYDAAAGDQEGAALREAIAAFAALLSAEPKLPDDFVLPEDPGEEPAEPRQPELEEPVPPEGERPLEPGKPGEDADEQALADWQEARAKYEEELESWAAYDAARSEYDLAWVEYDQNLAAYESYPERKAAYDEASAQLAEFEAAHAAWEEQLASVTAGFPLDESMGTLQRLTEDLRILSERTAEIVNTFNAISSSVDGVDLGEMNLGGVDFGGMDIGALQRLAALSELDLSSMTEEQMLETANTVADALAALSAYFGDVTDPFAAIDKIVADARGLLDYAQRELQKAEGMLDSQLANIWYNLGELEKDKEKLEEEKQNLNAESELLSKRVLETDELKTLKNRHISARQLLVNIPEVKRAYAETGDLAGSARGYLDGYDQETERLLSGKRLINLLAVIGAAAGLLGIPAAYEKIRNRFLLVAPVLVCLGCAAAADGINMSLGLGQMYTALFTAIFALIQLLIILPKKKSIQ